MASGTDCPAIYWVAVLQPVSTSTLRAPPHPYGWGGARLPRNSYELQNATQPPPYGRPGGRGSDFVLLKLVVADPPSCPPTTQAKIEGGEVLIFYFFTYRGEARTTATRSSVLGSPLGKIRPSSDPSCSQFVVLRQVDILRSIIPFFNSYNIEGVKSEDLSDFYKIAMLVKDKSHLTEEGMEQVKSIKKSMNRGRILNNGLNEEPKIGYPGPAGLNNHRRPEVGAGYSSLCRGLNNKRYYSIYKKSRTSAYRNIKFSQ